jgi:hypothetical protein
MIHERYLQIGKTEEKGIAWPAVQPVFCDRAAPAGTGFPGVQLLYLAA